MNRLINLLLRFIAGSGKEGPGDYENAPYPDAEETIRRFSSKLEEKIAAHAGSRNPGGRSPKV